MTFSERMGIAKVREVIQTDSLDEATRNALWNLISPFLTQAGRSQYCLANRDIWTGLYQQASDTVPRTDRPHEYNVTEGELFYRYFRQKVIEGEWYECLDFVEFIATDVHRRDWGISCYEEILRCSTDSFNAIFEQYLVGYRFVNGELIPVSSESEVSSIESAIGDAAPSVAEQLSKALKFLADRKSPDYAKSVDCAISAVEAQCRIALGTDAPTLGKALKQLEDKGLRIHPALKGAFDKLYGFTSDANGIRHAGMSPSDVDQPLAMFMLVACSAFVNYLMAANK